MAKKIPWKIAQRDGPTLVDGVDAGETPFTAALREGGEELTGFLGNNSALRKLVKKNGGTFHLEHNKYHVHMFYLPYD